jgi:hypothetical protein
MVPVIATHTSVSTAVTATAATLTSLLDTTKPIGLALYWLTTTAAARWAQGIADTVFTAATTDICTAVGHGMVTGSAVQVSNSGGALPTGLSAATTYFAIVLTTDTFKLATSRANALAGTAIDITGAGTGTQTATTVATTGAGSQLLPAGAGVYVDGALGAKISIIRDTADGNAGIGAVVISR